jgi:hypothetical protein
MELNMSHENVDKLLEYQRFYTTKKENLINEGSFNSYISSPEYTKSILILEAIKIMLTEIAPKRRKKKKVSESLTHGFADQLSNIAEKAKEFGPQATAFAKILESISDKINNDEASSLTSQEKEVLDFIKQRQKPIDVDSFIADGAAHFYNRNESIQNLSEVKDRSKVVFSNNVSEDELNPATPPKDMPEISDTEMVEPDLSMPKNAEDPQAMAHAHHYEYQASMARSELFRNAKYAMSMMKQITADQEIQPWIASELTKSATYLDKIFHYLDYYKKFEPNKLPEQMDEDAELGETSGSIARQNLMMIIEYSTKLFDLIKPQDKLEGWVAMKLTTASESISSCKHYMDYAQFENNGLDDHFKEARKLKMKNKIKENKMLSEQEDLAKASTILAAKDMCSKIQSIAEDIAKMSVEDLMPLVDIMRQQFGPEATSAFNELVKEQLDKLLDLATETKEKMDAAVDTINQGGVPSGKSDIESAGEPEAGGEGGDLDTGDLGLDDKEADAGGDLGDDLDLGTEDTEPEMKSPEPLGRRKKEDLAEKWNKEMNTAEKDIGKWDGWSMKELRNRKKNLMGKDQRTAAEEKEVRQLNFAIRAKQKDKWGKINESAKGMCNECGNMYEGSGYASCSDHKDQDAIVEKAPPGKDAENFIKDNKEKFKKQYGKKWQAVLYATAWKKFGPKNESYNIINHKIQEETNKIRSLQKNFDAHRRQFKMQVKEGKNTDVLNTGYGIVGQEILHQIEACSAKINSYQSTLKQIMQEGIVGMLKTIDSLNHARKLEQMKVKTPYGVVYTTLRGNQFKKLFETKDQRNYWLKYNSANIVKHQLINPETFDLAIKNAKKR